MTVSIAYPPGVARLHQGSSLVLHRAVSLLAEAPALAAFLPVLAQRLLGEALALPSVETLWLGTEGAMARIGREAGLNYVYIGNTRSPLGSNTFCPECNALVIERNGYDTRVRGAEGKCPKCGVQIPGVWK